MEEVWGSGAPPNSAMKEVNGYRRTSSSTLVFLETDQSPKIPSTDMFLLSHCIDWMLLCSRDDRKWSSIGRSLFASEWRSVNATLTGVDATLNTNRTTILVVHIEIECDTSRAYLPVSGGTGWDGNATLICVDATLNTNMVTTLITHIEGDTRTLMIEP